MRDAEVPIFLEMSICDEVSKLAVCSVVCKPDLLAPRRRGALCIVVRFDCKNRDECDDVCQLVKKGNDERNEKKWFG